MNKVLIVVDMQNDFVTGALGSAEAQAIVTNVQAKIDEYVGRGDKVIFTMDTHSEDYLITQEGKKLPVEHCISGTDGWKVLPELDIPDAIHITKSAFGYTGWQWEGATLGLTGRATGTGEGLIIELVGVCTDICVVSNAIILKAWYPEVEIIVDASCCAGVTPEKHKAALETMKSCQIAVINEG